MYSIGIDIGGMSAKLGLTEGCSVLQKEVIPTGKAILYEDLLDQICVAVSRLSEQGAVRNIGISSCGLIDSMSGIIVYSNNIPWENKAIVADLEKRTRIPVRIANDAKCAALAEAVYGAGKAFNRVCMITLGTGVGGAFIRNKRLDSGSRYSDADGILGHITVERGGRQCTCGRKGCLEAYASATAVMQRYKEKTGQGRTAKDIFADARKGLLPAANILNEFKQSLAEGLTSLVNVLRPEIIIVGGGLAGDADLFLKEIEEKINEASFGSNLLPVQLAAAELGNEAGILGAALL